MAKGFSTPLEANGLYGVLARATGLLSPVSPTPRLDAELLLAHALGITRESLLLYPVRSVPPTFGALLQRRLAHEPVAYITGSRSFWTLDLHVTPDVLIPRPDSETLIETTIAWFSDRAPQRVLDLGTGSGALMLAALDHWPGARGIGLDRSAAALGVARANAERLGFGARAAFVQADWADALHARFDLILCNPPYVEAGATLMPDIAAHEPPSALYAGSDGLDDYRRIVPELPRLLAPRGLAVLEVGATQAEAVTRLVSTANLKSSIAKDLGRNDRCVSVFAD